MKLQVGRTEPCALSKVVSQSKLDKEAFLLSSPGFENVDKGDIPSCESSTTRGSDHSCDSTVMFGDPRN